MAVVAVVSAKGSPGVSTAALAFVLAWGRRGLLAECDPAGGSLLSGYLQGQLPSDRGLLPLAIAELRGEDTTEGLWRQVIDLVPDAPLQRLALPGLTDPAQAGTVNPNWHRFAELFAGLEYADPGYDVIVDGGRLTAPHTPWPIIRAADTVLLAVRPTLVSLAAAAPAVSMLRHELDAHTGSTAALGLLLIGAGRYDSTEISAQLKTPVVAQLRDDPRAAAVLTHGGQVRLNQPLLRDAAAAERHVRATVTRHRQHAPRRVVLREAFRGTS